MEHLQVLCAFKIHITDGFFLTKKAHFWDYLLGYIQFYLFSLTLGKTACHQPKLQDLPNLFLCELMKKQISFLPNKLVAVNINNHNPLKVSSHEAEYNLKWLTVVCSSHSYLRHTLVLTHWWTTKQHVSRIPCTRENISSCF